MQRSGEIKIESEILVVVNPIAGSMSDIDEFRSVLDEKLNQQGKSFQIYETTGEENLTELIRTASEQGVKIVLAAGGDGTITEVINGIIHTDMTLGILPMGTGNGLARAMEIPLELDEAVDLVSTENCMVEIDVMHAGEKYFVLNVGTGISSRSMGATKPEDKRRFGIFAYVWTIFGQMLGLRPQRFMLQVDGEDIHINATEILISNGTLMEDPPDPLGPPDTLFDGRFEVYIVRARSLTDYLGLVWDILTRRDKRDKKLKQLTLKHKIIIQSNFGAQPVQGDGELYGQTPVEVSVVPRAVKLIVPQHVGDKERSK
jgi:diacylglycerol kinase (ATP)